MKRISFRQLPLLVKVLLIVFAGLIIFLIIIPMPKFDESTSTVVYSKEGELLGARIASDGQWRFRQSNEVPDNYKKALINYEDKWFYFHPGVNPVSLIRALFQNIRNGEVVSGGSTITMQVARLSRDNPPRTIAGKLLEICMSIKLEMLKSKKQIIGMYAAAAPFGGNVIGTDAASWRYFNRPSEQLSWAEASLLAILPNAPSLLFPGKNEEKLKKKRDALLLKLYKNNIIDKLTYEISVTEELPLKPIPLPDIAHHLTEKLAKSNKGENIKSTIDYSLQEKVNSIIELHHSTLSENNINNLSAIIVEVETGDILVYAGNIKKGKKNTGEHVDIASSARSSGSILKPFLYAAMLNDGMILPNSLVADIPININGFSPKNFDYNYSGAVPASMALSKSLNIPAVEMLDEYGGARFLNLLRNLGFTTFVYPAEHYGLSLILGGGETKLTEIAGAYASMARILNNFNKHKGYNQKDIFSPQYINKTKQKYQWKGQPVLSAASIWTTFNALKEVNRPSEREGWRNFSSSGEIAWKTGTSFGFRDAWAVGTTPEYVVAVWAGNASGEGRPGLTGSQAAAPVLFDILDLLPLNKWFDKPAEEIKTIEVCAESGFKASPLCPKTINIEAPETGDKTQACPYHHLVHLSSDRTWQVNDKCYDISEMVHDSCFILPPGMEWFYKRIHPGYFVVPPYLEGCTPPEEYKIMEILYPRNFNKLYAPKEQNGEPGKIVFEIAHRNERARLFWYLDEQFLFETEKFHQVGITPESGVHKLTIIDDKGNRIIKSFTVTSKLLN